MLPVVIENISVSNSNILYSEKADIDLCSSESIQFCWFFSKELSNL